jgi:hypothetical protein
MDVASPVTLEPVEFVLRKNVTSEDSVANIRVNEARNLPHLDFKRICICASGPSLADHIEDIRARQKAGWHVAAMNGSYNFLMERGIVADVMFMVDARPGVNLPFVSRPHFSTEFVIASQCDPSIFDALDGYRARIWPMFHDGAGLKAIQETRKDRGASFVGSLNVGQSCLVPLWAMGYKVWHLFGYDGSMRGDAKHAFVQPQNDGEEVQDFFWPMGDDDKPIEGVTKRYLATPTMAHGAQCFPERINYFRRLGIEIELYGEGLIPDMVAALSSTEGAVTAPSLDGAIPVAPAPKPRRPGRKTHGLPIVTFKWKGHIPYTAEDVNVWANQVHRHMSGAHELICITDDPSGIECARTIPMWRDHFEHGRDWHRLKLFTEEMADLIGPRFAVMDLDTLICDQIDPLFDNDHPFMAWRDPNRDQYCTSLFMMDAGAFPHVWETFDPKAALALRQRGIFGGYDQAWISHVLPGQPRWTAQDGVLSFRVDMLGNRPLRPTALPEGARIINFHGKYNPRDREVQDACPWVTEFYR